MKIGTPLFAMQRAKLAKAVACTALIVLASAASAHAYPDEMVSTVPNSADQTDTGVKFWMSSSEYYMNTPGRSPVNATPPRRVMISGYHPIAGFEAETAAEAANRATHTTQQYSAQR